MKTLVKIITNMKILKFNPNNNTFLKISRGKDLSKNPGLPDSEKMN